MTKVNTGTRTKAGDKKAQEAVIKEALGGGKELVEKDGAKYVVEKRHNLSIHRRVA